MSQALNKTKNIFFAGLFVLVPSFITFYIISAIISLIDAVLNIVPGKFHPDTYLPFHVPGLGVIYTVILALAVGLFVRNYAGKKALFYWERVVSKIPLVSALYGASRQVTEAIFSKNGNQLKKVVLIEYPRKGIYTIAFLTGMACRDILPDNMGIMVSVFVPTTPNPTSGFYLLIPEKDALDTHLSVDEAFTLILSGGMVTPKTLKKDKLSKNNN